MNTHEKNKIEPKNSTPNAYGDLGLQFIGGKWRPGATGVMRADTDPYNQKTLLSFNLASAADLNEAYEAAQTAQREWAAALPVQRAEVLRRAAAIIEQRKDEIISWLIQESGSTRIKAEMEWQSVLAVTHEAASFPYRIDGRILPVDCADKEARVYRQPLGVIGIISPWNWPMYLTHRSVAPALACGNAIVIKPAADTPVTGGLLIGKIMEEAGAPAGLVNVVVGDRNEVGDAFTLHPTPRLISFTGSTKVGKHLATLAASGPHLKRVALELGGNAPFVVLDDADLDLAVKAAIFGRFLHQGQICMSTNRIIIDDKLYDRFVEAFVAHAKTLKVGDPSEPDTAIGPIINEKQIKGMVDRIAAAQKAGAKLALGGAAKGRLLPPHVFVDVDNASDFAQAEQFGPLVPLIRAKNEADALALANDTQYGLSSAVFSQDERRALAFALQVQAGMTHINDQSVNDYPNNPFGGEKNSGVGRFGGDWIIAEFTTDHWITVQHKQRPYPF